MAEKKTLVKKDMCRHILKFFGMFKESDWSTKDEEMKDARKSFEERLS